MSASRKSLLPTQKQTVLGKDGRFLQQWFRFFSSLTENAETNSPTGMVSDYAGAASNVPEGWLLCDGSAVSRTQYAALFGVLGIVYGAGNGTTTFNLPDVRGRFTIGADATYALASTGGAVDTSLVVANLPSHNHGITDTGHTHTATDSGHTHGVTDPQHSHGVLDTGHTHAAPAGNFVTDNTAVGVYSGGGLGEVHANTASATTGISINNSSTGLTINSGNANVSNSTDTTGITINNTGSGTSFSRLPPYIAFNKIIKT